MKTARITYTIKTIARLVFPREVLSGAARPIVAVTVSIANQRTAATPALEWMPPMWYTLAQFRRTNSGIQVGTEQATLNKKLITYSCRMSKATVMFEAVAVARSESCRLSRVRR